MKARDNPFAMCRIETLAYRLEAMDWEQLLARFDQLQRRAALVGRHGTGKTTLLGEFATHWEAAGWRVLRFRLTTEQRGLDLGGDRSEISSPGTRHMVLLDGAEQLSWWRWREFCRWTRRAAGVLITTHRPGRLPTLLECRTTPELLSALVAELTPAPDKRWMDRLADNDLFRRHDGNVRDAFRELYDVYGSSVTR